MLTVLLKSRRPAIVVAYNGDTGSSIDLEHGNRRLIQSLLLGQGWLIFQFVLDFQGGNFHLKVGGAKSRSNAGDPMLRVAVIP